MKHIQLMKLFLSSLLLFFSLIGSAQDWDVTVIPQIMPPYSANYADYFSDPSQLSLTIINNTTEIKQIYLAGSITSDNESVSVSVSGDSHWSAPPLQVMPGTNLFSGIDLRPAIEGGGNSVVYDGIDEAQIILGILPEGTYTLCLRAYDYESATPLSNGDLGCAIFTILTDEPPVLLSPMCETEVTSNQSQLIIFNWMLPQGPPSGAILNYNFKLVMINDAANAQSALETSNNPVYEQTTNSPVLVYNQQMPPLIIGQQYAWWVQATTLFNDVLFNNQGFSAPCTFTYTNESSELFELVYPYQQDTLPWTHLPIIVHLDADPMHPSEFHSTLTKERSGGEVAVIHRQSESEFIKWYSGPFPSQLSLLNAANITSPFTQEMSLHINIYKSNPTPSDKLLHGSTYDLSAYLRLKDYDATNASALDGYVSGQFVSGMGKPIPLNPAPNEIIAMADEEDAEFPEVPLHFRTAAPPVNLFPPYPIYIIENGIATRTEGDIVEKWRLQVSRNPDMSDPVFSDYGQVGGNFSVNTSSEFTQNGCNKDCVIDSVYKEVSIDFQPTDNEWYYWQVAWLNEIDQLQGEAYHESAVRRFRIEGEEAEEPEATSEEPVREAECLAECRRPPTPTNEKIAVSDIVVGDMVQVGLFNMQVQQINFTGGFASGEGLIDVPVMRSKLRVNFTGVQINANKRLFRGSVKGMYDNTAVIPPEFIQGTSLAAGFNPQAAEAIDDFLNAGGRLVSQFAGNTPMGLPIGIDKEVPGGRFVVGILGVEFTDTIARLNAGMALPIHDIGTTVGLGNMAIPFHPGGIGDLSEEATLYMLGNIKVPIGEDSLLFKGARFTGGFTSVQDSGTFVAWDCRGFRAVTIDAEYRFSPEHLKEDLANGEDGPTKVIGAIRVRTGRGGFMGRVDFNKPFHLTNARGWGFEVEEAWLDLASFTNPPGLTEAVQQIGAANLPLGESTQSPSWTGLLMKRTMMRMPSEIERIQGPGRVTAQVDNLIYDFGQGISAQVKLANIIGRDEGMLDGWGFSMDTLQMDIISNSFSQGGFKGLIHVPCTDTLLAYSAMIQHDLNNHDVRIEFLLHPDGTLNIPMIVGTLSLQETSTVRAVLGDEALGTYAKADLNGTLDITADLSDIGEVDFKLIKFEHLIFQTDDPYTNAAGEGVFSLASPQKFMGGSVPDEEGTEGDEPSQPGQAGGFPVSITRVDMARRTENGKPLAGISFDLNLNLTGEVNIFTATTRFSILGELNTESLHEWGHHSVELDSIGISGSTGAVRISGGLKWYRDDAVYGDGIHGQLDAGFLKEKIQVKASAQFGNVNGLRYWYVDAMGAWQNGISPGSAFNVYGFGGGAWYHMKRNSPLPSALEITVGDILNQDDEDYEPGLTLSKVQMLPDASTSYGFQATVVFGDGAGGKAYNGDLTAGMTFNTTGGVNTAFLNGSVYLLSEREDRDYVPIHGTANISFDFNTDVFAANFTMYVDMADGKVVGSGPNNLAGAANILISPETWYFLVGKPTTPIGLKFAGFIEGQFYFMVGKDLPQSLPPPAGVASILPPNFFVPPSFPNADGVAFGARVSVRDTVTFFLFKLRMGADIGFDIAFSEIGDMECNGIGEPGIHGWYARGQLYAYVTAGLSLYVDWGPIEGEKHLLDLTAAAIVHGEFANPSWARGYLYASYNILGGAVSGSVNFEFNLGDPCVTPAGGVLAGLDPIGDLTPHDQAGMTSASLKVDCAVQPQAVFNMPINTEMDLTETKEDGTRIARTFRLILTKLELRNKTTDTIWPANMVIAPNMVDVTLHPNQYLLPTTIYTIELVLKAEELNYSNNTWGPAYHPNTTTQVVWSKLHTFKSDAGIQELRAQDIDYTYPFTGQRFLLQDECREGVIQCKSNLETQPLFDSPYGRRRVFKVVFTGVNGGPSITQEVTLEHSSNKSYMRFTIPSIANERTYKMMLVARDEFDASNLAFSSGEEDNGTGTAQTAGSNVMIAASINSVLDGSFNNTVNIRKRFIVGYTMNPNEKRIYDFHFRTSKYNTLEAKVTALQNTSTILNMPSGFQTLTSNFSGEKFDVFDINPFYFEQGSVGPMVTLLNPHTDYWFNNYYKPVILDYYNAFNGGFCASGTLYTQPDLTWANTIQPSPMLSQSETSPNPFGVNLGDLVYSNESSENTGTPLPAHRLYMTTAYWGYANYFVLQNMSLQAEDNCNNPGDDVGNMGEPLSTLHEQFQSTPYKVLYKGAYGAMFSFHPPTCLPDMIDWEENVTQGSHAIKQYINPSGPIIPPTTNTTSPTTPGNWGINGNRP